VSSDLATLLGRDASSWATITTQEHAIPLAQSTSGLVQFTSAPYLALLALSVVVYFLLPGVKTRVSWLLFLSCGFYLFLTPGFFVILLTMTVASYATGLGIAKAHALPEGFRGEAIARALLIAAVLAVLSALVVYKYIITLVLDTS
jgi:hypothetical protein